MQEPRAMLLIVWFFLLAKCSAYHKNIDQDEIAQRGDFIMEEDISLNHQVIQWEEELSDLWAQYYSIPWDLLNPSDLKNLGLHNVIKLGSYHDLQSLGPTFSMKIPISKQGLYIPKNTSLLFLFNTSTAHNYPDGDPTASSIRFPDSTNSDEAMQVIQTSLPFGLPAYHYVSDYSLLVPRDLIDSHGVIVPFSSASRWVEHIGLRKLAIPLSKDMVNNNEMVLAFVFRSARSLEDFVDEEELERMEKQSEYLQEDTSKKGRTYRKAKAYIDESLLLSSSEVAKAVIASSTGFFDNFAKRWVASVGYESLLYSTFCQVNCKYHEQSYCLKFREGHHATVSLLTVPSDEIDSKLKKRDFRDLYDNTRDGIQDKKDSLKDEIEERKLDRQQNKEEKWDEWDEFFDNKIDTHDALKDSLNQYIEDKIEDFVDAKIDSKERKQREKDKKRLRKEIMKERWLEEKEERQQEREREKEERAEEIAREKEEKEEEREARREEKEAAKEEYYYQKERERERKRRRKEREREERRLEKEEKLDDFYEYLDGKREGWEEFVQGIRDIRHETSDDARERKEQKLDSIYSFFENRRDGFYDKKDEFRDLYDIYQEDKQERSQNIKAFMMEVKEAAEGGSLLSLASKC